MVSANRRVYRADLDDGAFRSKVSVQDGEAALLGMRVVDGTDDFVVMNLAASHVLGKRIS
ncbi:hypothetical protein D3C77_436110 [compost metagenome]